MKGLIRINIIKIYNMNQIISNIVSNINVRYLCTGIATTTGLMLYCKTDKQTFFGYQCYQLPWMSLDNYFGYRWSRPTGHFVPRLFSYRVSTAFANNWIDDDNIEWAFFGKYQKYQINNLVPSFNLEQADKILVEKEIFPFGFQNNKHHYVILGDSDSQNHFKVAPHAE